MIQGQANIDPIPLQPLLTPQDLAFHDAHDIHETHDAHDGHNTIELPAVRPLDVHKDHVMPYATPYQLIFDSDSDKGDTPRETDHVS